MYYRIETYCSLEKKWEGIDHDLPNIWQSDLLSAPHFTKKRKFKGLFWFTEKGYQKIGKYMVAFFIEHKVKYRVKKIKENRISVNYKDKHQIVGKQKY